MEGGSFKAQLKRADRSGAPVALILGDDEVGAQGRRGEMAAHRSCRNRNVPGTNCRGGSPRRSSQDETSGTNDGR